MLTVENIRHQIGNKILLKGISAKFLPNRLNVLIGPNGAGKSTLLKISGVQFAPTTGTVFYDGKTYDHRSRYILSSSRAFLSQQTDIPFPIRVSDVVMMGRHPHFTGTPESRDKKIVNEALDYFHAAHLSDRFYNSLSGGERQRVHFARVFAQVWEKPEKGCRFLLLDEPFTYLDLGQQYHFAEQLYSFTTSETVTVLVMHDLQLALQIADHIYVVHEGNLVAEGEPANIITEQLLHDVYQINATIAELNGKKIILANKRV